MANRIGTPGNDTLIGAAGDDSYYYGDVIYVGGVIALANGFDVLDNQDGSGAGNDTLNFGNLSINYIYGVRAGSDFVLNIQPDENWNDAPAAAPVGAVTLKNFFANDPGQVIDHIVFADATVDVTLAAGLLRMAVITAPAGVLVRNLYYGVGGNDLLTGTAIDEEFHPGAGNDTVTGGGGFDEVIFHGDVAGGIAVNLALPSGQVTNDGSGGTDTLVDIDRVGGTDFNDALTGGSTQIELFGYGGNDALTGGSGLSFLQGGAGNDTLTGGAGFAYAVFWYANEGVTADLGVGTSSATNTNSTSLGSDTLVGIDGLFGSNYGDALFGDGADNWLYGGGGSDSLFGLNGNDHMFGGDDRDVLRAGPGDDDVHGDAGDDVLRGDAGNDTLDGGSGYDRVSYAGGVGANVDLRTQGPGNSQNTNYGNDTLIGIEHVNGSSASDTLIGDDGSNYLWGLSGSDSITGNGGDDLIEVGSGNSTASGDGGTDTLSFNSFGYDASNVGVVPATVTLVGQGVAQSVGGGYSMTFTGFENLSGSDTNDSLTGDGGNNVLAGSTGNDALVGGAGNDTLLGDGIVATDNGGTGISGPIVTFASVKQADANAVEGNDALTGGAGNDTLDGAGGTDTAAYSGLRGNYQVTNNGDGSVTITDLRSAAPGFTPDGSDNVRNVENFQFADVTQTLAQLLADNAPIVSGVSADETSIAFTATDLDNATLALASPFAAAFGNPTIVSGVLTALTPTAQLFQLAGTLAVRDTAGAAATVANLWLGTTGDDGTGGGYAGTTTSLMAYGFDGSDTLLGSEAADTLSGGAGDDFLRGRAGGDLLYGGDGNDVLYGAVFSSGTDAAGDAADTLYGGAGIDVLRGNAGADQLFGGADDDNLRGDSGNDTVDGGAGYDFASYADFTPADAANGIGATVDYSGITGTATAILVDDGRGGTDSVVNIEKFGFGGTVYKDALSGSQIDDQIVGNLGDDTVQGNGGSDSYFYFANNASAADATIVLTDGNDLLVNADSDGSGFDTLAFAAAQDGEAGVSIDNVYAFRSGHDLVLSIQAGTGWDEPPADPAVGSVTIQDFYTNDARSQVDRIEFADAYATVTLRADAVIEVGIYDLGDNLQRTLLAGVGGNDTLLGTAGNDLLDGGDGDDDIDGGGDGAGDTAYYTGSSSDYRFVLRADGSVTVTDLRPGSPDGTDTVRNVEFGQFADGVFSASDIFPDNLPPTGSPSGSLTGATEDQSYTIYNADLVAGFTDPEGGPLAAGSLTVDHGTVAYNDDGTWTYVPDANFNGPVTLSYEVDDTDGNGVDTSLIFDVAAVNDLPVANPDTGITTPRYSPVSFNVLVNDSDVDIARGEAQALSLLAVATPATGTVSFTADGNVTYTPPGNSFSGPVTFGYTVGDGAGGTATGSITVTITSEVWGTPGNDNLTGSTANDLIYALAGNDTIDGRGGRDLIDADGGDDVIVVSGNDMLRNDPTAGDTILGGDGTDTIRLGGNASCDPLQQSFATMSVERLDLNGKVLTVLGITSDLSALTLVGAGFVQGDAGNNTITGTAGSDDISGLGGADALVGGVGNDTLTGGAGPDSLLGGPGDDVLRVGGSDIDGDRYWGDAGTDTLQFTGNVTLTANTLSPSTIIGVEILDMAKKTLTVNASVDLSSIGSVINGGDILGTAIDNFIRGTGGSDTIKGGGGRDKLFGDAGNDTIFGGAGSDTIRGGAGNDDLYGSDSKNAGDGVGDAFVFDTDLNASTNLDTIWRFEAGGDGLSGGAAGDKIYLDGTRFSSVIGLYLDANEFVMNNGGWAADGNDFIAYDTKTGTLYFDADGNGSLYGRIAFAIIDKSVTGIFDVTDLQIGAPPP